MADFCIRLEQEGTATKVGLVPPELVYDIFRNEVMETTLIYVREMMSRLRGSGFDLRYVKIVVPGHIETNHDVVEMVFRDVWDQLIDKSTRETMADIANSVALTETAKPKKRRKRGKRGVKGRKKWNDRMIELAGSEPDHEVAI